MGDGEGGEKGGWAGPRTRSGERWLVRSLLWRAAPPPPRLPSEAPRRLSGGGGDGSGDRWPAERAPPSPALSGYLSGRQPACPGRAG